MVPKKLDQFQDKFTDKFFRKKHAQITAENPIINDRYKIFSSNEQIGYYVLPPSILGAISEIIEQEKASPVISFINGKMFMTIPWEKDYFSVNINTPVKDVTYFTKYINEINSFKQIIGHFRLNERI